MKKFLTIILCLAIASCARNLNANTVVSTDEAGIVSQGTILSVRQVTVKDQDKLDKNGIGMLGGAVAGGVAGSTVGKGDGQALATVGGALAGAALGSVLQDELSTSTGFEYIVKLSGKPSSPDSNTINEKTNITLGRDNLKEKLRESVNAPATDSNIISVVQGQDVVLAAGQQVYVIYSTDRIRLVPAN